MAQAPSGELFGLRESTLYQIDQATGAITPAGPGPSGVTVIEGGLDFHPTTGVLYGVNGAPTGGGLPGLFTIDTTTGVANVIAPILDFDDAIIDASALAFDDSGILYILRTSNLTGPPELWILDPSDASTLSVVPLVGFSGSIDVAGMDFDDSTGILWVVLRSVNALLKVDPMTGASTSIPMTLDVVNSSLEVIAPCGEGGGPTAFPVPVLPAAGIAFPVGGADCDGVLGHGEENASGLPATSLISAHRRAALSTSHLQHPTSNLERASGKNAPSKTSTHIYPRLA